jgi:signal transduction histidine kinase
MQIDELRATCRRQAQVIVALSEAVSVLRGGLANIEPTGAETGSPMRSSPADAPSGRLKLVKRDGKPTRAVEDADADGALARVLEAVDRQRQSVERDLHDGVQQRLVGLRIQLELAGEGVRDDRSLHGTLAQLGASLDEAIDELHDIARGIHPYVLTDFGLVPALTHIARTAARPVAVTSTGFGRHPAELERAFYYCCREAIQNACKHGGPTVHIAVSLHDDDHSLSFQVSDDGPGFDVAQAPTDGGLQHMRYRVTSLGGRLSINSQAAGTVVSGTISTR